MNKTLPAAALEQHIIVLGKAPSTVVPTASDKAYAAGFFDGEGNVCIAANTKGGKDGRYLVYNMRVGASQKTPETLFWFRDRWGGSVAKARVGNATYFHWGCFARGALSFLVDVLPYLQVKRERAQLAIKFQSASFQPGRRAHGADHKAQQAAMKAEMNRLNRGQ